MCESGVWPVWWCVAVRGHGPGCPPRQTVVTAWGVGAAHLALRGCEFFFVAINYVDEETHFKRLFLSILALLAFSRVIF